MELELLAQLRGFEPGVIGRFETLNAEERVRQVVVARIRFVAASRVEAIGLHL
jgi:hypothetical protein